MNSNNLKLLTLWWQLKIQYDVGLAKNSPLPFQSRPSISLGEYRQQRLCSFITKWLSSRRHSMIHHLQN